MGRAVWIGLAPSAGVGVIDMRAVQSKSVGLVKIYSDNELIPQLKKGEIVFTESEFSFTQKVIEWFKDDKEMLKGFWESIFQKKGMDPYYDVRNDFPPTPMPVEIKKDDKNVLQESQRPDEIRKSTIDEICEGQIERLKRRHIQA